MKTGNPITVLLAEDHTVVREGLRQLLDLEKDIAVTGEAATGREAVRQALKLKPAVVVMDIAMPNMNGLEACRQILKAAPATKVLILSAHSDDAYVESVMEIGAVGYLIKQSSAHFLCEAIRAVYQGKSYFSPLISKQLRHRNQTVISHDGSTHIASVALTEREREVLQLIAEGKTNKETASELGIGVKTVEKHRDHLMRKLDIHDTAGLTRYAMDSGVVESTVKLKIVR